VKEFATVAIIPELVIRHSQQPTSCRLPIGDICKAPRVNCKLRKEVRFIDRPPMQLVARDVRKFGRQTIEQRPNPVQVL
jgi:hypothetical protein